MIGQLLTVVAIIAFAAFLGWCLAQIGRGRF